ncbi:MAG: MT-A70 family methyltransferase [Shewanella sp.]
MYSVIAADPPWQYNDKKLNRGGAERHYRTLSIDDIKRINVSDVAAPDSICLLWATAPLLKEGIAVLEAWGFEYKTVAYVWVKRSPNLWHNIAKKIRRDIQGYYALYDDEPSAFTGPRLKDWFGAEWLTSFAQSRFAIGMGFYTRANAEFVLLGVRGRASKLIANHGVSQIIDACMGRHSAKPQAFFDKTALLTVASGAKLELFARERRAGWDLLGDQIDIGATYYLDADFNMQITAQAEASKRGHKT